MQIETDAIVLHTIKYSETSVIAHVFTEQFGKGSYIMNGVRKNRSKMAMFQPLAYVRMNVLRKKDAAHIHRIAQMSFALVPASISGNVFKSTMALFVGEMVNRIFTEEESSPKVFLFLRSFVLLLESAETNYANLHILFLLHLTKFLGVFPQDNFDGAHSEFSFTKSQFVLAGTDVDVATEEESRLFHSLLQTKELTDAVDLNRHQRQTLLAMLLKYYDVHVCSTQNIKSLDVLRMVYE